MSMLAHILLIFLRSGDHGIFPDLLGNSRLILSIGNFYLGNGSVSVIVNSVNYLCRSIGNTCIRNIKTLGKEYAFKACIAGKIVKSKISYRSNAVRDMVIISSLLRFLFANSSEKMKPIDTSVALTPELS